MPTSLSTYCLPVGWLLFLLGCTASGDKIEGNDQSLDPLSKQVYTEVIQKDTLSKLVDQSALSKEKFHHQRTKETPFTNPNVVGVIPDSMSRDLLSPTEHPALDLPIENTLNASGSYEVHSIWNDLLKRYVDDYGQVDYAGMLGEREKLHHYLHLLNGAFPKTQTPRHEAMAYWINAYNAFTIALILDHWPVNSIKDLDGGNPWDIRRISLNDKSFSLNDIEHLILRKKYADPRVHFALVCAAKSCPPLMNRAWKATSLEKDLEQQTKAFIRNPSFNNFGKEVIHISSLFDWYADDFENVVHFLSSYLDTPLSTDVKITFLPYDWKINSQ